jgi:hypothetical protein
MIALSRLRHWMRGEVQVLRAGQRGKGGGRLALSPPLHPRPPLRRPLHTHTPKPLSYLGDVWREARVISRSLKSTRRASPAPAFSRKKKPTPTNSLSSSKRALHRRRAPTPPPLRAAPRAFARTVSMARHAWAWRVATGLAVAVLGALALAGAFVSSWDFYFGFSGPPRALRWRMWGGEGPHRGVYLPADRSTWDLGAGIACPGGGAAAENEC